MILASFETARKVNMILIFLLITTSTETDNQDLNIAIFYSKTLRGWYLKSACGVSCIPSITIESDHNRR